VLIRGNRPDIAKAASLILDKTAEQKRVIMENTAGLKTWGYRRLTAEKTRDLAPGEIVPTGRTLDIALSDPTGMLFFKVTRDGKTPLYVRTLRLTLADTVLYAQSGLKPMGSLPEVAADATVRVTMDGWIKVEGSKNILTNDTGLLLIARLTDVTKVEVKDGWIFSSTSAAAFVPYAIEHDGPVMAGYLEAPNIKTEDIAAELTFIERKSAFAQAVLTGAVDDPTVDRQSVRIRAQLPWSGAALVALTNGSKQADGTIAVPVSNPVRKAEIVTGLMDALAKRVDVIRENLTHAGETAATAEAVYKPRIARLDDAGKLVIETANMPPRRIYEPNNALADKEGYVFRPAVFQEVAASEIEKSAAEYEILRTLLKRIDPDMICPPLNKEAASQQGEK
jgi:flagellar basal body rod protein FlgG/flagellar basal body rod protein FlgC